MMVGICPLWVISGHCAHLLVLTTSSRSSSSSGTKPLPPHVGHCCSSSVPFSTHHRCSVDRFSCANWLLNGNRIGRRESVLQSLVKRFFVAPALALATTLVMRLLLRFGDHLFLRTPRAQ